MNLIDFPKQRIDLPITLLDQMSEAFATPKRSHQAVIDTSLSIAMEAVSDIVGISDCAITWGLTLTEALALEDTHDQYLNLLAMRAGDKEISS